MKDLKQMWLIKIDPNRLTEDGITLKMQNGCIKVKQLGHYIESGDNSGRYTNRTNNAEIKKIMDDIQTITSTDLKNATALYRFPRLSLSRDKVKILQEKFDLKLKRDFNDADYGIVSEKYFDGLFVSKWLSAAKSADVLSWAQVYKNCFEDDLYDEIVYMLDKIPADAHVVLETDWFSSYNYDNFSNITKYSKMSESARNLGKGSKYHYYVESLDQWNNIQDNMSKLVWDTNINDLATEDSEVLTEEMYIQLKTMLGWEKTESGCGWQGDRDKENMNLALAMIANCNIKESHTYLALLFSFLSDSMKDAGIWNSVNFKSVRKKFQRYIDFSGWSWCSVYNHLLEELIKDDALTEIAWKEIAEKMYDDVLSTQYGVDGANNFSISPDSIQLKPEFKEKMKLDKEFDEHIEKITLDNLEAMVDMHTESHDYAR